MALPRDKNQFELILSVMWILARIRVSCWLALGREFDGFVAQQHQHNCGKSGMSKHIKTKFFILFSSVCEKGKKSKILPML
jgi:hypothetical protein